MYDGVALKQKGRKNKQVLMIIYFVSYINYNTKKGSAFLKILLKKVKNDCFIFWSSIQFLGKQKK